MDTIVDTLEMEKPLPETYAGKLSALKIRENDYPFISLDAIENFLIGRLEKEVKEEDRHGEIQDMIKEKADNHSGFRYKIVTGCIHRDIKNETIKKFFGRHKTIQRIIENRNWRWYFYWDEMPLSEYDGTPPEHILTSALRAKKLGYKELFVVTVNSDVVEDPLLIAIKNGKRYLVDWWEKDFTTDEIIKLSEEKK